MNIKPIIRTAVIAALVLIPTLAFADSVTIGASGGGGFFGITFGSGGGGGAGSLCTSDLCAIGNTVLYIINFILVPVLFALAFIVFLWGVFKAYIWSSGNESAVETGHKLILWGIIGFVVMISLWGLVNAVSNTFNLAGYSAPPTPCSIPGGCN